MTAFRRLLPGACIALAALIMSASAFDSPPSVQGNPGGAWEFWGNAQLAIPASPGLQGGHVVRATISPKPDHPWDIGAVLHITQPVKKGDVVALTFWARAVHLPKDSDFVAMSGRIFDPALPNIGVSAETHFLVGKDWTQLCASGTADKDYPPGTLVFGTQIGFEDDVLDIGPAIFLNFGPNYDIAKLPHN